MNELNNQIDLTSTHKAQALACFLKCEFDEITESKYDSNEFEFHRETYLVLTDDEADEKALDYIRESLWAFKASFLESYCHESITEEVILAVQAKYEDGNEALHYLVKDRFNDLVSHAICSDGRGHFIAQYDFHEHESGEYFIYRTN